MDTSLMIGTAVVALIVLIAIMNMSGSKAKGFSEEELAGPVKKKKEKKAAAPAPAPAQGKKKKKKALKGPKTLASDLLDGPADKKEDEATKSKKKGKKKGGGGGGAKPAAPKPKAPKVTEPVVLKQSEIDDGWGVVVGGKKSGGGSQAKAKPSQSSKKSVASAPSPAPQMSAKAADAPDSEEVRVDSRKLGIIIGPAGATIKTIQEGTGARIELPDRDKGEDMPSGPCIVTITGTAAAVKAAKKAVEDLCKKGYSSVTEGAGFTEGAVSCPVGQLAELIGKRGTICQAIQTNLEVKLNFPDTRNQLDNFGRPKKPTVKVGIAGEKTKVQKAKQVMKEILKFHHHPLTHPGMTHIELDVPQNLYSVVIGPKGSTIKHLKASFGVEIYIPRDGSAQANILVVGLPNDCTRTKASIAKMIEKATAEPEEEEYVDETYDDRYDDEGPHEAWMDQYKPPPRKSGWDFN